MKDLINIKDLIGSSFSLNAEEKEALLVLLPYLSKDKLFKLESIFLLEKSNESQPQILGDRMSGSLNKVFDELIKMNDLLKNTVIEKSENVSGKKDQMMLDKLINSI